ncbi:hypothetical protein ABTK99_20295, partial [Acinetobacter baumannii]
DREVKARHASTPRSRATASCRSSIDDAKDSRIQRCGSARPKSRPGVSATWALSSYWCAKTQLSAWWRLTSIHA